MCGIAGVVALRAGAGIDRRSLSAMCDTLTHRGPDDAGLDLQDGVGLAMRRLSIIDVAGGRQPLFNEDRSIRTVFNGEIYNFRELRQELEADGHRFGSATDGEVLVHLWEDRGSEFVQALNGMFAVALHDMRRGRVVLARDRIGIKPLFYAVAGEYLVFGSEIKALLASGLVPRDTDLDALGQFMAWEYVPAPRTMFAGIHKLEPGTILQIDLHSGEIRKERYWDVPAESPDESASAGASEWEERVDASLTRCVRRQLVSDVPLGAFLSGGVDSSLVVHAMGQARSFSIGFDDPTYDESAWAERVARHLGVSHRMEIQKPQIVELFEHLMQFMEDPIGDFSIFPTFLVSRLARQEVKVVLSGDGGDELFGGYETYLAQDRSRIWNRIPSALRSGVARPLIEWLRPSAAKKGLVNKAKRFVEGAGHEAALGHARWRLFAGQALREELFTADALSAMDTPVEQHILDLLQRAGARGQLNRGLYADLGSYLVDNCLVKVDRMSMACSLEARVPLLDHELVELAFQVPERLKLAGGETKVLLKRIAARYVPAECVYRPKQGFSIPIKHWLNRELRPLLNDLLDEREIDRQGILKRDTVARLKREHASGRANHSHVLWSLMVFQDWRRRWSA